MKLSINFFISTRINKEPCYNFHFLFFSHIFIKYSSIHGVYSHLFFYYIYCIVVLSVLLSFSLLSLPSHYIFQCSYGHKSFLIKLFSFIFYILLDLSWLSFVSTSLAHLLRKSSVFILLLNSNLFLSCIYSLLISFRLFHQNI